MNNRVLIIHTDGGSRGNPGPAACAFIIETNGSTVYKGSKYLGATTNNVAEYQGVLIALKWIEQNIKTIIPLSLMFVLDSELVVKQLKGEYRVKDSNLNTLFLEVKSLVNKIGIVTNFTHVRREENKIADTLVNEEMDRNV